MRQTISGLAAALALIAASAAPAKACGGLFDTCSPCGYVGACVTAYVPAYTYGGCGGDEATSRQPKGRFASIRVRRCGSRAPHLATSSSGMVGVATNACRLGAGSRRREQVSKEGSLRMVPSMRKRLDNASVAQGLDGEPV